MTYSFRKSLGCCAVCSAGKCFLRGRRHEGFLLLVPFSFQVHCISLSLLFCYYLLSLFWLSYFIYLLLEPAIVFNELDTALNGTYQSVESFVILMHNVYVVLHLSFLSIDFCYSNCQIYIACNTRTHLKE